MGIDIGTYSSKGVLVTQHGEVVASHVVPHTIEMPHPGWVEQDADDVWWHDFVEICRQLLATSGVAPGAGCRRRHQHHLPLCAAG